MLTAKSSLARYLAIAFLGTALSGCSVQVPPGSGSDNDNSSGNANDNGSTSPTTLRVAFDARGGNYAAGVDDADNQYAFRARDMSGAGAVSEANLRTPDGEILKVSFDGQGRPVNFRASDNSAADLVYEGETVRVRLTDADGEVVADESGLDPTAGRERALRRREVHLARTRDEVRSQIGVGGELTLTVGLEAYEEIAISLFDDDFNPRSPLANSSFAGAALTLAGVVSVVEIETVSRVDIETVLIIDAIPSELARLAGNTFVLFDAEGFCVEQSGVASRLTFDLDGILLREFDRRLVFPDLSLGGSGDPGVVIDYIYGDTIDLTPDEVVGFELYVTPVFTGTQVDEFGNITVERRFESELIFMDPIFGNVATTVDGLFDAALVNGEISSDGELLEFDLVLVDLYSQASLATVGRLRYREIDSPIRSRQYDCSFETGERVTSSIICPGHVEEGDSYFVEFIPGRETLGHSLTFDWYVSDGYGYVLDRGVSDTAEILPTSDGFLEVTLIMSDLSEGDAVSVFVCETSVSRDFDDFPDGELIIECPGGLNVGEPGFFSVTDSGTADWVFAEWFIFGTGDAYVSDPFDSRTVIEIYRPGKFEVAFQAFDDFGEELYVTCEVLVGGYELDECELNGWYGDGVCDEFCLEPDPDCDIFFDICEINGYYGDGDCDVFCAEPDPDCDIVVIDICQVNGYYGDGACDLYCFFPDPDCDAYDPCRENGYYGDGICDEDCPEPDPDCDIELDICEASGYYNDGECDDFCLLPDPDCEFDDNDICAENGYYGDGECDEFCAEPDPDCEFADEDICEINNYYGDGVCDEFCLFPDPDCS